MKLIEIDKKTGKYRLSMRALQDKPEGWTERRGGERRGGPRHDGERRGEGRGPRRSEGRGPRRESRGPRREPRQQDEQQ